MTNRKSLQQALTKEEALLSGLDKERDQAFSRINEFKRQLASLGATCAETRAAYAAKTPQEKVSLFRSLFRGRQDIYPKLWTSRAGKARVITGWDMEPAEIRYWRKHRG